MMHIRRRLTYANVISTLCLFLLLGGGASYAAIILPKKSVGTKQLKNRAVNARILRKNSVNSAKVKNHSLRAVDFKGGQIGPRGPSDAYYTVKRTERTNSNTVELPVPAGSYVVTASMVAATGDPSNAAALLCELEASNQTTNNVGRTFVTVGPAPSPNKDYKLAISDTAFTIRTGGGTISYRCSRPTPAPAVVLLAEASIIATQVETLH
jgi:hypothetical protein